jgi:DNA (cytosine-5)-methyltransferase 1
LNFLSLFSGIGGLDLGLERAGMRCVGQVEIDPYCRRVLAKHWPNVPRFEDVRTFKGTEINERIDLIAGGFPCQDISNAGKRAGIDGERSGLWSEFHRIICAVRPCYVLVENVRALLIRGFERVLGDLAGCGYDAEWDRFPACAFGAPHIRDRLFVVAHANSGGCGGPGVCEEHSRRAQAVSASEARPQRQVADTYSEGLSKSGDSGAARAGNVRIFAGAAIDRSGWWSTEPAVGRVAHGVPHRVDRLRGLGNAVVPQVAEWIGRRIMEAAEVPA